MRAGQLRHKVTIQRAVQTIDSSRQPTDTWVTFADVWAAVEPSGGSEPLNAEQQQPLVTHRVRIRWRDDVSPKMRVMHGARKLYIESILNVEEREREAHLMCRERVA